MKFYVVAPHQNCLTETVFMRGHSLCFLEKYGKVSLKHFCYSLSEARLLLPADLTVLALTLLHSEQSKLYGVLAILSAIGLISSGGGNPFGHKQGFTQGLTQLLLSPPPLGCYDLNTVEKDVKWQVIHLYSRPSMLSKAQ